MMLGAEPNPFTKPIFARPMRVRRTRSQKVPSQEGENNLGKYRFHVIDGNNKHSVTGKNLQY
jgi:hypothetical protein